MYIVYLKVIRNKRVLLIGCILRFLPVEVEQLVFPTEPLLIWMYQHIQTACCLLKENGMKYKTTTTTFKLYF